MIESELERLKGIGVTPCELLFSDAKDAMINEFGLVSNDDTDKGIFNVLGHEVYITSNVVAEGYSVSALIDETNPALRVVKSEQNLVFKDAAALLVELVKEVILDGAADADVAAEPEEVAVEKKSARKGNKSAPIAEEPASATTTGLAGTSTATDVVIQAPGAPDAATTK